MVQRARFQAAATLNAPLSGKIAVLANNTVISTPLKNIAG